MAALTHYMNRLITLLRQPLSKEELYKFAQAPISELPWPPPEPEPHELPLVMHLAASTICEIESPFQAARLCLISGVFVENGAPADEVVHGILYRTHEIFGAVRQIADHTDIHESRVEDILDLFESYPVEVASYAGANYAGMAAMTTLTRDKAGRTAAREIPGFRENAEYLQEIVPAAYYLGELLGCVDDFLMCVIHPDERKGYCVRADGVRNNFHLFTLLQAALIGDPSQGLLAGPEIDRDVVDFAHGRTQETGKGHDSAIWWFNHWTAWTEQGLSEDMQHWIWGEGSPRDIRMFRDTPIILLSPPIYSRSWDVNFVAPLHDAHTANVQIVQHLSEEEVANLLNKFAVEAR